MNLVRFKPWRPLGELTRMHDRINRLFDDALQRREEESDSLNTWYPPTDIYETENKIIFKMEIPGLSKEDVKIEINDNTLTIKGEKKVEKDVEKDCCHRVESFSGSFSRSFTLPRTLDTKKMEARLKDGILKLEVAKAEEQQTKAIPIDVS